MKKEQVLLAYVYGVPTETEKVNSLVTHAWLKALNTIWM